jgi:hypothetical protein
MCAAKAVIRSGRVGPHCADPSETAILESSACRRILVAALSVTSGTSALKHKAQKSVGGARPAGRTAHDALCDPLYTHGPRAPPDHPPAQLAGHGEGALHSGLSVSGDRAVIGVGSVTPECDYRVGASLKTALDFLHSEWHYKLVGFVTYDGYPPGRGQ